ncbi:MAG: hypothetical protein DRO73_04605 [Candidatus Thorarchaeota archaeon]|nr:MAG: hypothetical protein DRO73_04605 [Candidatus Thorarchaeota archaeon]RLI62111.1 MAG: hypothetical protein DRO93_02240 [Candidatus Thorarchaeota archaeon]
MNMSPRPQPLTGRFETETVRYLVGDLGLHILLLIDQGCTSDAEIMKFSTVTATCLDVKIPLLKTLGLVRESSSGYEVTSEGLQVLREIYGW